MNFHLPFNSLTYSHKLPHLKMTLVDHSVKTKLFFHCTSVINNK